MAIAKNGLQGNFTGKIGNTVYYMLNGKNIARKTGDITKEPTESKINSQQCTKICNEFLSKIKGFIKNGFDTEAKRKGWNYFNAASHYNRNKIITGFYPDIEIAYDQVIVSKGGLKPAENWSVTEADGGLRYQWNTHPEMPWPESTDQVMMLAYFPDEMLCIYELFGAARIKGTAFLEIPPSLQGKYVQTYISFVAADRSDVADGLYTGAFNSGSPEQLKLPF